MTPVLCFDLETIPDAAGLRKLGMFDASLDDAAGVVEERVGVHGLVAAPISSYNEPEMRYCGKRQPEHTR